MRARGGRLATLSSATIPWGAQKKWTAEVLLSKVAAENPQPKEERKEEKKEQKKKPAADRGGASAASVGAHDLALALARWGLASLPKGAWTAARLLPYLPPAPESQIVEGARKGDDGRTGAFFFQDASFLAACRIQVQFRVGRGFRGRGSTAVSETRVSESHGLKGKRL